MPAKTLLAKRQYSSILFDFLFGFENYINFNKDEKNAENINYKKRKKRRKIFVKITSMI